jgi:hypothetical protein
MAKRRSTWVLAILAVVAFAATVMVAGVVWFFTAALERSPANQPTAEREFAEVRARFQNSKPIFEMGPQGPVLNRRPTSTSAAGRVRTLHILGWNPDGERLTHVTLPFWLIRLRPGSIRAGLTGSGTQISIDADELESYGSTLVLDHTDDDGERIVMWTE